MVFPCLRGKLKVQRKLFSTKLENYLGLFFCSKKLCAPKTLIAKFGRTNLPGNQALGFIFYEFTSYLRSPCHVLKFVV